MFSVFSRNRCLLFSLPIALMALPSQSANSVLMARSDIAPSTTQTIALSPPPGLLNQDGLLLAETAEFDVPVARQDLAAMATIVAELWNVPSNAQPQSALLASSSPLMATYTLPTGGAKPIATGLVETKSVSTDTVNPSSPNKTGTNQETSTQPWWAIGSWFSQPDPQIVKQFSPDTKVDTTTLGTQAVLAQAQSRRPDFDNLLAGVGLAVVVFSGVAVLEVQRR